MKRSLSVDPANKRIILLIWLISIHTTLLIASMAGGAKIISVFGGLAASATVFSYAVTFPIADLLNELGGPKVARLAVNIGFLGVVVTVAFLQLSMWAPPAPFWEGQAAYQTTFGFGWRILLGGWVSYLIGNHVDVTIFQAIRRLTGERHYWIRKNGSTAVSQLLDTVIFMTVAFGGTIPIASAIPGQYLLKLVVAVICTPLSHLFLKIVRRMLDASEERGNMSEQKVPSL